MSSDEKVLDFPKAEVTPEEKARRVTVEATRLASLDQRFRSSNHIRPPCRAYRPRCERRAPD
jgi:hypothetical protein